MSNKYYIHKPDAWNESDRKEIEDYFKKLKYKNTIDAARGLGAGGPGWEIPIEIILQISGAIGLGEQIFKLARFLHKKRPKKLAPESQPEIYQLIVHVENKTSVVINLNEDVKYTEAALDKLDEIQLNNHFQIIQNKDDWDKF